MSSKVELRDIWKEKGPRNVLARRVTRHLEGESTLKCLGRKSYEIFGSIKYLEMSSKEYLRDI